jgi:hypothetical protein
MGLLRAGITLFLAASLSILYSCACLADRRVALVIGNSQYKNTAPVQNPANDAADMAAALRALGFDVLFKTNLDKHATDLFLAEFARMATDADAALVFYAGHGMQFQGRNYIMPIDAELEDEFSLRYQMTVLDDIRGALERASGPKILILDACRNNPLAERLVRSIASTSRQIGNVRGFTRPEPARGMVIAYSTQADDVAQDGDSRNSPFTRALLNRLKEPGLEIGAMFRRVANDVYQATNGKQLPELSISLLTDFYLNQAETDAASWARIRATEDADTIRDFLIRFPSSPLASEAKLRLELIERSTKEGGAPVEADRAKFPSTAANANQSAPTIAALPPAASKEATMAPDQNALIRSLKAELRRLGCYSGPIDEDWQSPATKRALSELNRYASLAPLTASPELLNDLKAKSGRLCPLLCPRGQTERNGRCAPKMCPHNEILSRDGNCLARPVAARPRPRLVARTIESAAAGSSHGQSAERTLSSSHTSGNRRCFFFAGKNYCE